MTFNEFCEKIYEYINADNLEDLGRAKDLLEEGSKEFTDPDELEAIGNISSEIFLEVGYLLARDKPSTRQENDDYVDDEDDDDFIRCGPSTGGNVEYISG
jgi:hypothetical protein